MIKFINKILRIILFGRPIKGESANYVNGDFHPKLKKWDTQIKN